MQHNTWLVIPLGIEGRRVDRWRRRGVVMAVCWCVGSFLITLLIDDVLNRPDR